MRCGWMQFVVGLLILAIGAGPACACVARQTLPAARLAGTSMKAADMGDHACCRMGEQGADTTSQASAQGNESPGRSCPHCDAMLSAAKALSASDQQMSAALHVLALAPAVLTVAEWPTHGAGGAVFSSVWSPPPLLNDLFHTFCLLTL